MPETPIQLIIARRIIRHPHELNLSKGIVTFINPFSYLKLRKMPTELLGFDGIGFDGISMCIIWKFLYGSHILRTSFDFTSCASLVFSHIDTNQKTVYFIGSEQKHIDRFVQIIKESYQSMNIIGHRNGFFLSAVERGQAIEHITNLNPDFIIAGMGTGFQEQFLMDLQSQGWSGCGFTCGGFIHQTAGSGIRYYPHILDKLHMRWIFRIWNEPKLLKRYLIDYPVALFFILKDYFSLNRRGPLC